MAVIAPCINVPVLTDYLADHGLQNSAPADHGLQDLVLSDLGLQNSAPADHGLQDPVLSDLGLLDPVLSDHGLQDSVLSDHGLQYSVLSDLGLLDPAPADNEERNRMRFADDETSMLQKVTGRVLSGLKSAVAIMMATLPVYSLYYYTYPLHSLLLNLIVIPLMGGLMVLGIAAMLAGSAVVAAGAVFGAGGLLVGVTASGTGTASWGALGGAAVSGAGVVAGAGVPDIIAHIAGFPVHLFLQFYKFLCSSTFLTRNMTWYMGHAGKWQVFIYLVMVMAFVFLSGHMKEPDGDESLSVLKRRITNRNESTSVLKRWITVGKNYRIALSWGILLAAVFVLTFHAAPEFEIDMIDVGQGDGIVISCGGKNVLIDGGSSSKKDVGKYQIIPFLKYKGIGSLDAVILTHEDEDHLSGIRDIFEDMEKGGIAVEKLILPEVDKSCRGENYHELEEMAHRLKVPVLYINQGESLSVGDAEFTCINPSLNMKVEGANEYSTVLFMKYGDFTALFSGDMEGEGLENVKKQLKEFSEREDPGIRMHRNEAERAGDTDVTAVQGLNITLLKVAHHGSRYTTDEEFLQLVSPKVALISCGRDNSYGHPHDELLQRLENAGSRVYRTDVSGEISVLVEDGKIRIEEYIDGP